MTGNCHVPFLGEGVAATPSPYPARTGKEPEGQPEATSPAAYPTRETGNGLAGWPSWRCPTGRIKRPILRDGRVMDSSPGGTFLRPIGATIIPHACHKPSRFSTYRARLMGLGGRIDVIFHAYSDVYARLGLALDK